MDPYVENGYNFYDIRLQTQYNFQPLTNFLNQKELQQSAFGGFIPWQMCNMTSHSLFNDGWEIDRSQLVSEMLQTQLDFNGEKYYPRFLLIGGTDDFAVNAFGVKQWTLNMKWPQQQEYADAHDFPFYANTLPAGTIRSVATNGGPMGFSFAAIFNAGHMAPHDAPEPVYRVLLQFIKNEKFFQYDLPQKSYYQVTP
jgi:carboxypeptidase C (cathepsin A)